MSIIQERNWEFEYVARISNRNVLKDTSYTAYFNDVTDDNIFLASFEWQGKWMNYKLINSLPTSSIVDANKITYTNCYENVDVEFITNRNGLKENIIVKQPISNYKFEYTLKGDLNVELIDNEIHYKHYGETVFKNPKPFALDSNGLETFNVVYSVVDNVISVELLDEEFLDNAVFPIVIDPTALVPSMTANNSPSPYVASASTQVTDAYDAYKAFNNANSVNTDRWGTDGTATGWVKIDLGTAKTVTQYDISAFYNANNTVVSNRSPKDWTLQGSNDDTNWTTLDTRTGITGWTSTLTRNYTFANSTGYRYYKLNVTKNGSDNSDTYLSVGELVLYEEVTTSTFVPVIIMM